VKDEEGFEEREGRVGGVLKHGGLRIEG